MGEQPGPPAGALAQVWSEVLAALRTDPTGTDALSRIGRAARELLSVDGASIALGGGAGDRQVLYASDPVVERIEDLQFSLGEGPGIEAYQTRRPVLVPDLAAVAAGVWPIFASEIGSTEQAPIAALFAFPIRTGAASIGALDLYRRSPGWLSEAQIARGLALVDLAALVLTGLAPHAEQGAWLAGLSPDRAEVHRATGMLIAAHRIPAAEALDRLRAHAYATGRRLDDIARAVTTRRILPTDL